MTCSSKGILGTKKQAYNNKRMMVSKNLRFTSQEKETFEDKAQNLGFPSSKKI